MDIVQTPRIDKRMKAALALAELSRCRNRHGAVLLNGGVVISAGVNSSKLSSEEITDDNWRSAGMHAEAAAITSAGSAASGSIVYVSRVNKAGQPVQSAPCKRCQGLAERRGVRKIVHT